MMRLKSMLRRSVFLLLAAALVTVLVAWLCATMVVVEAGPRRAQGFMNGEVFWNVERWDRPGATYAVSSIIRDWPWSPSQATGPANTPQAGDRQTAWASATADGQREWLCLEFAKAVVPKSVRVYENDAPGAIDRVTVFKADG